MLPFLAALLDDPCPQVWKAALDGLVAMPCAESAKLLDQALSISVGDKRQWIAEALEQVRVAVDGAES